MKKPNLPSNLESRKMLFENSLLRAKEAESLGAFISLNELDSIQENSSGSLSMMTLGVKDNIHVQGMANTAGTAGLARFIPDQDASVITRLKAEGAIIVGKTNMHELAFGITSLNNHFGPVRNPYDKSKFAGGSSGGSAAAVAARIVRAAVGTDTGGSVRLPAALCGVIGFRPSIERYSTEGITPVSSTRDVPGPIALTMSDITLLDAVMSGRPQVTEGVSLSKIRLGISRATFFRNLDPEVSRVMDMALSKLQQAGVVLVEIETPEIEEINNQVSFPIALYEGLRDMLSYLETYNTGIDFFELAAATKSPDVKSVYNSMAVDANHDGRPDGIISRDVYDTAMKVHRVALQHIYSAAFSTHNIDALVFPTTILPAGPIADSVETVSHNGQRVPTFTTYIQNTDPGSNAGIPGISLPIGFTKDGLPVGLELDGPFRGDESLLAIAIAVADLFERLPAPKQ